MGYTHAWRRPKQLDPKRFALFLKDCSKIIVHSWESGVSLRATNPNLPDHNPSIRNRQVLTNRTVRFTSPDAHDIFQITMNYKPYKGEEPEEGLYFQCCKTARLSYDTATVACLLAFKHHFPEAIIWSDGFPEELEPGNKLYQLTCGYGEDILLTLEGGCGRFNNK